MGTLTNNIEQRYGAPRTRHRPVVVAAVVVLAAAGICWLLWVMLFHGRPLAQSEMVAFEVNDAHSAEATVTVVRRSEDVEASCLLRAAAADHSVVGELNFTVGSGSPSRATVTKQIRTERTATSVSLVGCVAEGQNRRR